MSEDTLAMHPGPDLIIRHYRTPDVQGLFQYGFVPCSEKEAHFMLEKIGKLGRRNRESYGGFTLVIDTKRRVMGIALCSLKDQYNKKKGIQQAMEKLLAACSDTTAVLVPEAKSRVAKGLCKAAVWAAWSEYMKRDWPLDEFHIDTINNCWTLTEVVE